MTTDKPLPTTKAMVWKAYQQVNTEWEGGRCAWSES